MPRSIPWTDAEKALVIEGRQQNLSSAEIAAKLMALTGNQRSTDSIIKMAQHLKTNANTAKAKPFVDMSFRESGSRSIEDLLAAQMDSHRRKLTEHDAKKSGITITMPDDRPYGVAFPGDPHLGDPGCNITAIMRDLEIVDQTDGLHAINMGDLTNNWVGFLQRLYGGQEITTKEETEMMRWLLKHDWLAVILGNHDKWSDKAEMLCRELGVAYVSHGSTFKVHAGDSVLKIDARHTHRGHSQYNPAHAQAKQNYRGSDAHIIVGAHTHVSAYTVLRNGVSGHMGHAIRVGSYKEADEYADANGFHEDTIAPSCMAVVDPREEGEVGFVQVFWDLQRGADYLTYLRSKA
jgi:hypothetical protein